MASDPKHVLFIVENSSVPYDARVWKEALAVRRMGLQVSAISPQGIAVDQERRATIGGIEVYRYPQIVLGTGFTSYCAEYINALWWTGWLVLRVHLQRRIHVFHVANPPDIFFLVLWFYKLLGAKYIFDIHDLFVNAFESKYQDHTPAVRMVVGGFLKVVERINLWFADIVIVTNRSYREYIVHTYRRDPASVFTVRNAPPLDNRSDHSPDPALKRGKQFVLVYFGVMGEDDGVDVILRAVNNLMHEMQFDDFHCYLIGPTDLGESPAIEAIRKLHQELDLESHVTFTGYLPWKSVHQYLNTADLGLSPDVYTRQNDLSTMTKIMEYMSHGLPIVSFELTENRYSAGEAAIYCVSYDFREFAQTIHSLLHNPQLRSQMSRIGLDRYHTQFNWEQSVRALENAYRACLPTDVPLRGTQVGLPTDGPD